MALAAIVVHCAADDLQGLLPALQIIDGILETAVVLPDKIAATLESPSDILPAKLREVRDLPGVWNLELVYVNYEDDLEAPDGIKCPPIETINQDTSKRHRQ